MAVSKRLRFEVLRRDNHTCRYCGASAPEVKLTVDHVVPEALGGRTEPQNLVTACGTCNSGKSSVAPDAAVVADVAQDALRWKRAMEMARIGDLVTRQERDDKREEFKEAWERWTYQDGIKRVPVALPLDWAQTIDVLCAAGLEIDDLADAIEESMRRRHVDDKFRYFCGVSWNMVKARQEMARILAPNLSEESLRDNDGVNPWPTDF